jgi:PTH1 family peptidyl-tRNA hydrolase
MKLIVGLGNPGKEYNNTRHNIGFRIIDNYALKLSTNINKNKFNGMYSKIEYNNNSIILLKPLSYMNLSGEVIKRYIDYFKIDIKDILIINDDLDINIGSFKLKSKGSSGGHNGLKSIEELLGTNEYKRLKIGISNNKNIETKDYVLGKFTKEEELILEDIFNISINILDDYLNISFDNLMNKYNSTNKDNNN